MLEVNFNPFPELKTKRLLLRRLINEDIEGIFDLRSNKLVMKFIGKNPITTTVEATYFYNIINDSLEKNMGITWAVSLIDSPEKLIGTIGMWRLIKEHFRGEVGYMFLPQYWGKGLAHEALKTILIYGFDDLKLHSVEAHINPRNTASAKLLEKTGFVREAYFKEDYFFDDVFEDTAIYSLLTNQKDKAGTSSHSKNY